jgi:hypothetical protein
VAGNLSKHVIKKRQSRVKMTGAITVKIDTEIDLGFGGIPIDGSLTHVVLSSLEILFVRNTVSEIRFAAMTRSARRTCEV